MLLLGQVPPPFAGELPFFRRVIQLVRDLTLLEQKHGLSSAEFYQRYQRGEMGDEMEIMRWASKFEIYEKMKDDLDNTFSLLERDALPAPA